ncbi:MAG: hypothetical protein QMB76_01405 [Alphaproteobacteria bacterium]|jgi:hypothetical protein|tara:strand:- start:570 stop:776 length:207 start_codon:yes stop_codon:yes gene_type:complete
MINATSNTTASAPATTDAPAVIVEDLNATIRAAEALRSETIYQAFSAAKSYLKQAPSRLFSVGNHRHA